MTDWILSHYSERYKIACLSRGYKRKSKGFVLAETQCTVQDLGDESYQIFRRWGHRIRLAVDANRVEGVKKLALRFPDLDWVVLDDAFQHRAIRPDLFILLTSASKPFYKNQLLPAGTLRDVPEAAGRAQMVVFTKAEELSEDRLVEKKRELNQLFPNWKPAIFLSGIAYHAARNLQGESLNSGSVVVCVAGLANNTLFFNHCREEFLVEKFISRPDHYRYLPGFFQENNLDDKIIVCTEKDVYKLLEVAPRPENVFYIPLSISLYPEAEFRAVFESHLP